MNAPTDTGGTAWRRPDDSAPHPRRAARLAAVQALYQMELAGGAAEAVIGEFARHGLARTAEGEPYGPPDIALFSELVRGVTAHRGEIDNLIAAVLSEEWSVERLETVLRAILRAGAFELSDRPDVPPRVVISEYVKVADAFFAGKEPALVNGVLDRLAHALRPDELGSTPRAAPAE